MPHPVPLADHRVHQGRPQLHERRHPREFIWDFEEKAQRIRPITPGLAISEAQFAELIDTCRHLDRLDRAAEKLIALTIPP